MTDRVLVTGGSGFVGRRLVAFLRGEGAEVHAPERNLLDVAAGSFPDLAVDWVIHLAGRTFVPASWSEPADFYRVNALGTVNVLEYCRRTQAKLIHVSGYCYGIPESLPISETAPLKPNNPYAFSKGAAEEACRFFSECLQTAVMIVRPFNIYGPGQSANFLIPHIVEQAIDPAAAAIVVEDSTPRRDYVHLDDVIGAIESLRRSPKLGGTFNIGSGESYSVAEVAEMVRSAANVSKPFVSRGNRRVNDIPDVIADITAIRDAAGWSPSITLRDGLRDVVTHARAHGGSGAVV
ncbi:glucose 4-epimerase [Bradyrhizobium diazoefficiens]|uniref:NAD-dependent epimerase/dehydratase family protein n=1 Tax=Bradyrhizobium diazoefficiens TaxID=1355477 RepID=UPI000BEA368A|nr:NAD-dependent epimerase/dehydratase family protein [Bradyrhizobium diazoefficiens]PDT58065.1 glucose 4-epimerase [Bradyrhizobium diazoefficiens]